MARNPIPAEAREIPFEAFSRQPSDTAASATDRKFGPSGVIRYRVTIANGAALSATIVEAATGDEAAERALAKHPGCKVANVTPASDEGRIVDDFHGEAA